MKHHHKSNIFRFGTQNIQPDRFKWDNTEVVPRLKIDKNRLNESNHFGDNQQHTFGSKNKGKTSLVQK